ncbi:hypothetical protein ACHWWK_00200 [Klebsiella pneumoniae]
MNSTSADFQNLYQALSHSAARSPDALALAFEDPALSVPRFSSAGTAGDGAA